MKAHLNNAMLEVFNPTKYLHGYKLPKRKPELHVLLWMFEKEFLQTFSLMTE